MKDFQEFGVMLDCSRNGVVRVDVLKKFIDCISAFGYNQLQLYTEDTYEIDGEPYFGYMRGRYTKAEIAEIDAYAQSKGVELVPCIQTLAHLATIFRHGAYGELHDIDGCLLVECDRTYALIEKMIKTCAENFSSKKINLGMDESMRLGLGRYFLKNGFKTKAELLSGHVNRVYQIAKKYGFTNLKVFHDQFAWCAYGDDFYYKPNDEKNEEFCASLPADLEIVYWDYGNWQMEDRYNYHMKKYSEINGNLSFACGAYRWSGYFTSNRYSIQEARKTLADCKKNGINKYLVTTWGDAGNESSIFSILPTLYSIAKIANEEKEDFDEFENIVGIRYESLMLFDEPNYPQEYDGFPRQLASAVLYSDLFQDQIGGVVYKGFNEFFKEKAERFKSVKAGEYTDIFELAYAICDLCSVKAELGNDLRDAYSKKDRDGLYNCVSRVEELVEKGKLYEKAFRKQWAKEKKTFGYECVLMKIGALQQRWQYCKDIIIDYLEKRIDCIEELDVPILYECTDINSIAIYFHQGYSYNVLS